MSKKQKRYFLTEEEIPTQWYNIQADMVNKPMPPLNPATKEALKSEDLFPIFAEELARQELDQTHAWIDIPEEVRLERVLGRDTYIGNDAQITEKYVNRYFPAENYYIETCKPIDRADYVICPESGLC